MPKKQAATHRCAAVDCEVRVALHLLMCREHWYMVTPMTRLKVLRHYQKGQERDGGPGLTGHYVDAMKLAIQEVAIKEGKTVPGPWL